jgi:hypothetical protein
MARTKQTARQSTGGPAPLKSLSLVLEPTIPSDATVATLPVLVPFHPGKLSGATATRSTKASRRNTRLVDKHAHVSSPLVPLGSLHPPCSGVQSATTVGS